MTDISFEALIAERHPMADAGLHPIFEAYRLRMVRLNREVTTIRHFVRAAALFCAFLNAGGIDPTDPPVWLVEEYFQSLPLAPGTKKVHMKYVRAAYHYSIRRGVMGADPTRDVEIEGVGDSEPRILDRADLVAVMEHSDDHLFPYLLTFTGMRRHEVAKLAWQDVNLRTQTITVMGKGKKLRKVPIHPQLGERLAQEHQVLYTPVLATARDSFPSDPTIQKWTVKYLLGFTPHDFRRTVASSLYRNGVPTDTIDKIMGWAPRSVRSRYYVNIAEDELQRAILKLYVDAPL